MTEKPAPPEGFVMPEATDGVEPLVDPDAAPGPTFRMPDAGERAPAPADGAFEGPAAAEAGAPELVARAARPPGTVAPVAGIRPGGVARRVSDSNAVGDAGAEVRSLAGGVGVGSLWVLGVCGAFLPAPWRRRFDRLPISWTSAAVASGVLEAIIAGAWWARAFMRYAEVPMAQAGEVAATILMKEYGDAGDAWHAGNVQGAIIWLMFIFSPAGLALSFFFVEGVLRMVGAAVSGETRGSLPLWLAERGLSRIRAALGEARQGPRVRDEITPAGPHDDHALRIASCRAKPWDSLATIEFEGRHYRLDRIESAPRARHRHVYFLRLSGEQEIIRALHHYDPAEVLRPDST